MNINFKSLDDSNKQLKFLDGIFQLETNNRSSWVWTSHKVGGIVSNIKFITIKAFSDIDNVLFYDKYDVEIKRDSLNIIKFDTAGKDTFSFELQKVFNVETDNRDLGIKIVGILIDGEAIF